MFERFTERARQVVVLAQEEARALRHDYIGTEHILLGLLREEEGLAARVLASLDVNVEEVRAQVARIVGPGEDVATGQVPFTPRAKRVLELSLREAIALGHGYIGTEHVLLGLVRENDGVAARILLDFGLDAETIRREVVRVLSGPAAGADGTPRTPFTPQSPPFSVEVVTELERMREEKERALSESRYDRAAELRDRERRLTGAARTFNTVWEDRDMPFPHGHERAFPRPSYDPAPHAGAVRGALWPRRSPLVAYQARSREWLPVAAAGAWTLFAVAVGVVLGRPIRRRST